MKILFIYSLDDTQSVLKPLRSLTSIQFGISYISSLLHEHNFQTQLLVLGSNNHWKHSVKLLQKYMKNYAPKLVCFTAVSSQYPFINKIASFIKTNWSDKYLIIGGAHTTLNPTAVITDSFDALCIGEGEYPLLELCHQIETKQTPHGIANLWIKRPDGTIERNLTRPFHENLDDLPFPDRAMWEPWMKEHLGSELAVLLGRGCPYNCTYCCNHVLKKAAPGKYVRMRSPEGIIKEIATIHKEYPNQQRIYFEVESIALNKDWLLEYCRQLEDFNSTINNSILYSSNFRISPQSMDEKIFVGFKKANIYKINIGLEAGSERIRRKVLKRDYSNKDFLDVVSMARKYGLKIYIFNMIGLPGETYNDYMETVSLNRQIQPDGHYTGIFFPYPGTELYNVCVSGNLIESTLKARMERRQAMIDFPIFSKKQIQGAYTWFNYRVYKGYKPLWWILMWTVLFKVTSIPLTNLLFRKIVRLPILRLVRTKFRH
jgi:radical SAM superfamily enzyme YgiQ (UPF0313 family)